MPNGQRECTVCNATYVSGTYRQHDATHPRRVTAAQAEVLTLLSQGHTQSAVARMLGVSRQRIHAIVTETREG